MIPGIQSSPPAPHGPRTRRCAPARSLWCGAFLLAGLSLAQAQVLDGGGAVDRVQQLTDRATERALERLERNATEAMERSLDETSADPASLAKPMLPGPNPPLPEKISILNTDGSTAFRDVAVEDGWRAVERQWLLMLEPGEAVAMAHPGIDILEQTDFSGLDLTLVRFRVVKALDSRDALGQLLPAGLMSRLDRNHVYASQSDGPGAEMTPARSQSPVCEAPVAVGMVDTAIQADHPAFAGASIIEHDFPGDDFDLDESFREPQDHGTAVAGLLVGTIDEQLASLPRARLYNASVFYSRDALSQGATTTHLVKGLSWLLEQEVSVINMSLAGPDNRILGAVVKNVSGRGVVIVAAAGNAGPAAAPLFPAAYPEVIAVTAVDRQHGVYRWANRGDHVDFAALGVDIVTARAGGEWRRESGTSMAAPTITAFAACERALGDVPDVDLVDRLAARAKDLGAPGRDPVFGHGLLR